MKKTPYSVNNYERIKQMSVEDMAEFLSDFESMEEIGHNCPDNENKDDCIAPFCEYGIKQWLLSEVQE